MSQKEVNQVNKVLRAIIISIAVIIAMMAVKSGAMDSCGKIQNKNAGSMATNIEG